MRTFKLAMALAVTFAWAGCGPDNSGPGVTPTPDLLCNELADTDAQTACNNYPRSLELQTGLMANTCSPNPGVCHQTNNYPDMHTPGNLISVVMAPCNVELPDPTQGWDNCELPADVMTTLSGYSSDVAFIENLGTASWRVGLRIAPTVTVTENLNVYDSTGGVVLQAPVEWGVTLELIAGVNEAIIAIALQDTFVVDYVDSILATVVGGDNNRNGTYGADVDSIAAGAVVFPGDLDRSYLWGRITGTVPGTRMPLANGPVTQDQYIALACWIEGLSTDPTQNLATDYIDYAGCAFAANPIEYEISDF